MPRKKIGLAAAAGCLAVAALGGSADSASAATVQLQTGLNSPKSTHTVVLPAASTPGALNAITQVAVAGPGELSNINIVYVP